MYMFLIESTMNTKSDNISDDEEFSDDGAFSSTENACVECCSRMCFCCPETWILWVLCPIGVCIGQCRDN